MKYYFILQYRILNRLIADNGMNPLLFGIALLIFFIFFSNYFISKSASTACFYALIPIILAFKLNDTSRSQFLKSIFCEKRYVKVRAIENTMIALPFILCLVYNEKYLVSFILFFFINLISPLNVIYISNYSLVTPFYKRPFEFSVGFRKTFPVILLAYVLAFIAVIVTNFNLGLFSLVVVILLCTSYYMSPEEHFYVWCHSLNAKVFLLEKAKIAIAYTTLLCFPILLALTVVFKEQFLQILIVQCLGYVYVLTALLGKYSNFPKKINLLEVILFSLSVVIVPLLVLIIPYFYIRSQKRLKEILE